MLFSTIQLTPLGIRNAIFHWPGLVQGPPFPSFIGFLFSGGWVFVDIGIAFSFCVIFKRYPSVEINASNRALALLEEAVSPGENFRRLVRSYASALTYVLLLLLSGTAF